MMPIIMALLAMQNAPPPREQFTYCSVPSDSPRGVGLIITNIFSSKSNSDYTRTAFSNFLRNSYAPYGNGWIFADPNVQCQVFARRRAAEVQRALDISRVAQPKDLVFYVNFEIE